MFSGGIKRNQWHEKDKNLRIISQKQTCVKKKQTIYQLTQMSVLFNTLLNPDCLIFYRNLFFGKISISKNF